MERENKGNSSERNYRDLKENYQVLILLKVKRLLNYLGRCFSSILEETAFILMKWESPVLIKIFYHVWYVNRLLVLYLLSVNNVL